MTNFVTSLNNVRVEYDIFWHYLKILLTAVVSYCVTQKVFYTKWKIALFQFFSLDINKQLYMDIFHIYIT